MPYTIVNSVQIPILARLDIINTMIPTLETWEGIRSDIVVGYPYVRIKKSIIKHRGMFFIKVHDSAKNLIIISTLPPMDV